MIPEARMVAPWWKRLASWFFGERAEPRCPRCQRAFRECGMFLVSNRRELDYLCGACALEELIKPENPSREFVEKVDLRTMHVHELGKECPEHPTPKWARDVPLPDPPEMRGAPRKWPRAPSPIAMPVPGPGVPRKG